MRKLSTILAALGLATSLGIAAESDAGSTVNILVLNENGLGTAAQAQPYIDKLVEIAAQQNGWSSASGKWITSRERAKKYVRSDKPQFGILSLGAFLELRKPNGLTVIGQVDAAATGGRQYFLVSKSGSGLGDCKGKSVASNHADDAKFIDKVVAGGAFKLGDFKLDKTSRPVQTLKKVIRGDATCALIDDAQLAELSHIDGGSSVKKVWSSSALPPMAVVAFSGAPDADRAKFKASLGSLCAGAGKTHCDKVGIKALKPADESAYASAVAAYGD